MSEFTIENDIPMPSIRNKMYDFDAIAVGGCMTIKREPTGKETLAKLMTSVRNAVWAFNQKDGNEDKQFNTRSFPEEDCVRVYRTA